MKQDLISVVVPVYKVENFLHKCVQSICEQTYRELEIILVDDGSPDNCGAICDEYAKKDERIKVIHKKNGGLSDARNAVIEAATGKYIGFVDSDDYINPQMYEILYEGIKQNDADISVCRYQMVDEKENVVYKTYENINEWIIINSDADKLKYSFDINTKTAFIVAWNKLYKTELFKEIRYPYGKIHEDQFTTYKTIHLADKIVYTEKELYYYLQRQDSIMNSSFDRKRLHNLDAIKEKLEFYKNTKKYDWYAKNLESYRYLINQMKYLIIRDENAKLEWLKPYKKYYDQQVMKNVWKLPIGIKRLGYLFYVFFPEVYYRKKYEK